MSRADLHPAIQADYDAAHRRWVVVIPQTHVEDEAYRQGRKFVGPTPSYEDLCRTGRRMGEHVAEVLAKPGPVMRAARAQVKKNNRKRFGPQTPS